MTTTTKSSTLRVRTSIKSGGGTYNHNALKVRTSIKSGGIATYNHNALKAR